jgi:hypothetical protein
VKQKIGFVVLFMLAVTLSGCIRPQANIPEALPAEQVVTETAPTQPQEPLPPINERLDGTVWVASSDMFEDIPIGAMTVYTFGKNILTFTNYRLTKDYKYSTDHDPDPYITLNDQTIEYFRNNSRYTVHFDGDDLVKTAYLNENDWEVRGGKAKAGDTSYIDILYPYSAELRDMDITKTLVLEGTSWKAYGFKDRFVAPSEYWKKEYANIERYWANNEAVIDRDYSDKSNIIFFSDGMFTLGLDGPSFPYLVTPRYIILLDEQQDRICYVQGDRIVYPYTEGTVFGYIKQ